MTTTGQKGAHFPQSRRPSREPLCFPPMPGQWEPCRRGPSRKEAFISLRRVCRAL